YVIITVRSIWVNSVSIRFGWKNNKGKKENKKHQILKKTKESEPNSFHLLGDSYFSKK
ncbi:hypothetical protein ACJX0J_028687, partial [Zea mays]